MWWFHTAQFARNGYFAQLLVTTTLGMVALQALAARAAGAHDVGAAWLRAGTLGTWTVCTVAAGMIGFQRFQGTLVHVLRSSLPAWRVLFPIVGAGSVFGLAALPLAAGASALLGLPVAVGSLPSLLGATALLWLACLSVSLVVGMLFVLTPNAMSYEGLLAIPLVLISGVFGTPPGVPDGLVALAHVLPTRGAVDVLSAAVAGSPIGPVPVLGVVSVSALWLGVAGWGTARLARRALTDGSLELV